MRNDLSAQLIFNWIVEKLLYIGCVLFLFFGAAFAEVYRKEGENPLPFWKKTFSVVFSVALMSMVFGSLIRRFEFDPYLMCGMAAFMGMGSHYFSLWLLDYWQKTTGLDSFLGKVTKTITAIRGAWNLPDKPDTPKDNESDSH